jgi:predicted PurR-regulated permease PerM
LQQPLQNQSGMAERNHSLNNTDAVAKAAATAAVEATWPQTRAVLRVILIVLSVAAALWMLHALQGVILLVVLAVFFAYLLAPLVEVFHRPIRLGGRPRLTPRPLAIVMVYLILFATLGVALSLVLPPLGNQMTQLVQQAPVYATYLRDHIQSWSFLINPESFPATVREGINNALAQTMESIGKGLTSGLSSILGALGFLPWLILIPILAFFLLKDAEEFRRSALMALPRGNLRWRGADLFEDVNNALAAYIRAQLTACLLIGVTCTVGFAIIGVPYTLVLGVIAGLLEFIPLVGPFLVAVTAIGIAAFYSAGKAAAVLLFLGVLRVIHDYVVYPRLMSHGIHLHPLAVILAILCGHELAGAIGVFLAIPVLAVLTVCYRHWLEYRGSTGLVSDLLKPAQEPPSSLSQGVSAPAAPPSAGSTAVSRTARSGS